MASPADTNAEKPLESGTWVAAGAVLFAVFLACGTGFPQDTPTAPDAGTSPILRQGTIHEEDLSGNTRVPAPAVPEASPVLAPPREPRIEAITAPAAPATTPDVALERGRDDSVEPEGSYKLPPVTDAAGAASPQRRASMKLVQQGQDLLRTENYKAALARFERAIGVDASNPYSHYFVARAHYSLTNYRESLSFLDVAEFKLTRDARWLAEIHVLRARNATGLGFHGQADVNYIQALALNPRHGFALAELTTIRTLAQAGRNR